MFEKKRRSDRDFAEEIEAHILNEADRLAAEGIERSAALDAARRAFGNVTGARERFYEARRWMWLEHFGRDASYALRQLKASPVASATIVLSLALGIGVNTAVFSLADQALVRLLPVRHPEQLVLLDWKGRFVGGGYGTDNLLPHPFFRDLRGQNEVFQDMFARAPVQVHLSTGGAAEAVQAELVSGSYFPVLGVRPALGRLIGDSDDDRPDAHPVAVLSYDYWRNRLGADPAAVGKRVLVNNHPMTVIGVAAAGFRGVDWGSSPALWIPMTMKRAATPGWDALFDRRTRFLHAFGRLRPGVTRQKAEARLQPWFQAYLREDMHREGWPQLTPAQMKEYLASHLDLLPAARGRSDLGRYIREPMLILVAATALILLLACLNVANLSLAKTLAQSRMTALRTALGASRGRIVAQQLTESALAAAAGCGAGVLLAPAVARVLISFLPQGTGGIGLYAGIDSRALAIALGISVLAALVSGIVPAWHAASLDPVAALKQGTASIGASFRMRKALVTGQFALALILLIGAGLFTRTLAGLRGQGPGFPTANLLMFGIEPTASGYSTEGAQAAIRRVRAVLAEMPALERVATAGSRILDGGGWNNAVTVQGRRRLVTDDIGMNAVSPGFFAALGVAVVRGRDFDERDSNATPDGPRRSAIVNEEFVRKYLPGEDPIGVRVGIGDEPDIKPETRIVGVVKSFHDFVLKQPEAEVFFASGEDGATAATCYVRWRGGSEEALREIRAAVRKVDPALTLVTPRTVDDQLDRLLVSERMLATLAGGFAVLATVLAAIGLYGVLAFSAASRAKEIGIRLALGAPRSAAGGLIVREAAAMAAVGGAIAIPFVWALGRLVASELFGVGPTDPAILAGAGGVLAAVCMAASAVPARKVGRLDPLETIRGE